MNNTLYLFRHGLATKNAQGYGNQIKSAMLLPEGVHQAEKIGKYLKNIKADFFYSSEYLRCTQTSNIVSEITGIPYQADKRLNEYDEISFSDFVANLSSFFQEISKCNNQNVFICTHVANIIILKKLIFNYAINKKDIFSNDPASGIVQIIDKNSVQRIDVNQS